MRDGPILVFGGNGQVGSCLSEHPETVCLTRADIDITDRAAVSGAVATLKPRAILNAAAFTAVDLCETQPDLAMAVNADGPGHIARAAADHGCPMVHISTDYVFDGDGFEPHRPSDPARPLSVYGASKAAGEDRVRAAGGIHAIVRTSWVFAPGHANFVSTMLRLSDTHPIVNVVDDQIGAPTPADHIAAACLSIASQLKAEPAKSGTYHLAGHRNVSWADFADHIFSSLGKPTQVIRIPSSEYPTPATRPTNSRLCCETLHSAFGINRPDWQRALEKWYV